MGLRLDVNILFGNNVITDNLAGKSVRGGIITISSEVFMLFVNIIRTIILSRLLLPEDFGIIGMVSVFIGFVVMFKDAGLTMATIQKAEITEEQISTLAWINFFISTGFGIIIIAGAPVVGWFYNKTELIWVTIVLAVSFILSGTAIQHRALLTRGMRFGTLTIINIASTVTGLITTIILAVLGYKYWSLVAGTIVTTAIEVILTLYFIPWMPRWISKGTGVRQMLKFGMHISGSSIAHYFSRNADNLLIGKFIGATELGLYNRAYQIFLLPISNLRSPLNKVAVPALSSLQKDDEGYKKYFYKLTDILATTTFPLAVYLYFESSFIILLMLGEQWTGAIPVFKLLVIAGFIQTVASQAGLVMVTVGQTKRYLKWAYFSATIVVISFITGLKWGIEGVAGAYAAAEYLLFIPSLFYCYKESPINPYILFKKLIIPFITAISAGAFMEAIKYFYGGNSMLWHILYLIIFWSVAIGLNYTRREIRVTMKATIKEIIENKN